MAEISFNFAGVQVTVTGNYIAALPESQCCPAEPSDFELDTIRIAGADVRELFEEYKILNDLADAARSHYERGL